MDGSVKGISRGTGGHLTVGLSKIEVIVQESFGAAMQPSVWVYVADVHQPYKTHRHLDKCLDFFYNEKLTK